MPRRVGRPARGGWSPDRSALIALSLVLVGPSWVALVGCAAQSPAMVESRDGSAPVPSGYYRVRSGDTLDRISLRHGLPMADLAQWNGLAPPYTIYAGSLLKLAPDAPPVPGGGSSGDAKASGGAVAPASAKPPAPSAPTGGAQRASEPTPRATAVSRGPGGLSWQWPLPGRVVQGFREGDPTRQGIRIAGRPGQQVVAAESGTVVYSGSGLKGYGNLIILRHNNEYLSAYGFNRRLLVKEGQAVRRGQAVAEVGEAGGEHLLHFEIRRNGVATNPLRYLPKSR